MRDIRFLDRVETLRHKVAQREARRLSELAHDSGGELMVDLSGLSRSMVEAIRTELKAEGWRFARRQGPRFRMVWIPALPFEAA